MKSAGFLKRAFIYGLGNLVLQMAGLILLPIYTRALEPADFGTLEMLNRLGQVLTICLLTGGIRQATLSFYRLAEGDEPRREVAASAVVLVSAVALSGAAAAILAASPFTAILGVGTPNLFRLAIAATCLEALTLVPLALIQARVESALYVGLMIGQFLVKVGLSVLLVVGLGLGLGGVLTASAATVTLFGVGLSVAELVRARVRPDPAVMRGMAAFAAPFLVGGIGAFIMNNGDRFFLLRSAGGAVVGTYSLGYRLATLVSLFSEIPLSMVWSAQMYDAAKRDDAPQVFGRAATRILAVYTFVGLGLCLLQDEVVRILAGERYMPATAVIAPLVLAYWLVTLANLMDAGFYVRRKTMGKLWVTMGSTTAVMALYALLIPRYGAAGAAYATLAGFAVHATLTWYVVRRIFPVHYESCRLAVLLGSAAAFWGVSRALPTGTATVPLKLGLYALWPVVLWVSGLVTAEEKQTLIGIATEACARLFHRERPVPAGSTEDRP